MTDSDKSSGLRKAYGAATKRLREAHRDEFNQFMQAEAKTLGIEWSPKPTDEQKAATQLAALLADYPGLREQMGLPPEAGPSEDFGGPDRTEPVKG